MRYEVKYLINSEKRDILLNDFGFFLDKNEHPSYPVSSIYFDDFDNSSLTEKKDGLPWRTKLRFRSYSDNFFDAKQGSIELKSRAFGKISKQCRQAPIGLLKSVVFDNDWGPLEKNLPDCLMFKAIGVNKKPKVLIRYYRKAFRCKYDKNFRLTIDSLVTAKSPFTSSNPTNFIDSSQLVFPLGNYILEAKTTNHLPKWFLDCIIKLQIQPQSISKYAHSMDLINKFKE